jgi:uncharacterized protein (TIGR02246 family)
MFSRFTVPAVILAAACQPSANPGGLSAKDEAAVRAVDSAWVAGANAGQAEGVAATYASDAVLLPPNGSPVEGHDAIRDFWGGFLKTYEVRVEIGDDAVEGRGDLAYIRGHYTMTTTPKAGAPALPREDGKYLEVLKRRPDGSWRYAYDMYSSNTSPNQGATQSPAGKPVVNQLSGIKFGPDPDAPKCFTLAVEQGDPEKGPSVILAKFSPGCVAPWHWHSPGETAMAVSGALEVQNQGDKPFVAGHGDFVYLPSHHVHRATCQGSAPCLVFLSSDAPFDTHWVDEAGQEISLEAVLKTVKPAPK